MYKTLGYNTSASVEHIIAEFGFMFKLQGIENFLYAFSLESQIFDSNTSDDMYIIPKFAIFI